MSNKQSILVTGSSSGFGLLTAKTLAENGHIVFATMRDIEGKNQDTADSLRKWAEACDVELHVVELDVTSDEQVQTAVDTAIQTAGRLDTVVNNAGTGNVGVLEGFTVDQAKTLFDINYFGAYRLFRAALPHMRERQSGLFITVSSTTGRIVVPFVAPYSDTKFALESLAESYSTQLAPFGIESVIVEPGSFGTDAFGKLVVPADDERLAGYGEMARQPGQMFAQMAKQLQQPGAPNPQAVAEVICDLVNRPAGKRPLRTSVGPLTTAGVDELNEAYLGARQKLYAEMGMV